MGHRFRQFFAALTAKVTAADRQFVNKHLSAAEAALFFAMNLPDQQHSLRVAQTALELAGERGDVDRDLLLRCALLHDVGKVKGDVSTADKVLTVLAHKAAPKWAACWGRPGRGSKLANLRHAFYVYFHHPARSAAAVLKAGDDPRVPAVIARHHQPPTPGEPVELTLLRQADNEH